MEQISTASRVRQMAMTAAAIAGGVYAAVHGALSWELVVLILVALLAYTAKSVLQQAVAAARAYFERGPK